MVKNNYFPKWKCFSEQHPGFWFVTVSMWSCRSLLTFGCSAIPHHAALGELYGSIEMEWESNCPVAAIRETDSVHSWKGPGNPGPGSEDSACVTQPGLAKKSGRSTSKSWWKMGLRDKFIFFSLNFFHFFFKYMYLYYLFEKQREIYLVVLFPSVHSSKAGPREARSCICISSGNG